MCCPYCGHKDSVGQFNTKEQVEYIKLSFLRLTTSLVGELLKQAERAFNKGSFFSVDIKVKSKSQPIAHYIKKQLQENIVCENCRCEYAIYGIFAVCPSCRKHNLFRIFSKNLNLVRKQLELEDKLHKKFGKANRNAIDNLMKDLRHKLVEDACENVVTVFETCCKEMYNQSKYKAINPSVVLHGNPFQSLDKAKDIFLSQFNVDIFTNLSINEINKLYILFNKRHILTHNLGIIDQKFLMNTGLQKDILNHKVEISKQEVFSVLEGLKKMVESIKSRLC
jgi:uncharacterized protein YbaR (Trm112 family)